VPHRALSYWVNSEEWVNVENVRKTENVSVLVISQLDSVPLETVLSSFKVATCFAYYRLYGPLETEPINPPDRIR